MIHQVYEFYEPDFEWEGDGQLPEIRYVYTLGDIYYFYLRHMPNPYRDRVTWTSDVIIDFIVVNWAAPVPLLSGESNATKN